MMPRAASISSTMRRPSGNRKGSQIAWLMISGGKRWPAYGERAGVVIPLGYPAHSATASPSARNLTVPLAELGRDMARLRFVMDQIKEVEAVRLEQLARRPDEGAHAMIRLLARIVGVGIETADMLVREVLSRNLRDRRAVARYAGLTGSPDESGRRRREKGLAKAGNA